MILRLGAGYHGLKHETDMKCTKNVFIKPEERQKLWELNAGMKIILKEP
jgi:hypothetical protein